VMLIPQEMQTEMLKAEAGRSAQAQGAPEAAVPGRRLEPAARTAGAVYAEPAPMEAASAPAVTTSMVEEYAKNATAMMNLLSSFQQRQERQLEQFTVPLERIQQLYYQSEVDRKTFINQLDTRFKSVLGNVSFQQRMVIYGFLFGLMLLAGVIYGFYLILGRMRSRREEMIMKYQQEMLKMVRDMAALPGSGGYGAYLPSAGGNARLTSAPVQQIAAMPAPGPMPGSDRAEPGGDLEQLTQVGNFKERALAAVRMLSQDAERAVDILRDMAGSLDPFQRENTYFALGEQFHPLTLELLLAGLQDAEQRVRAAAIRSLRRLDQNLPDLPDEIRVKIQTALRTQGDDGPKKRG
jgi:hypothetical protein